MNFIEKIWRKSFITPDRGEICDWLAQNIEFSRSSPFPGKFRVENLPWTRRIFEAWQDPKVRYIGVSGAPQVSGKTVAAQLCMAWQAVNDPTSIGFYADTGIKAEQFRKTRWNQTKQVCQKLRDRIKSDTNTAGTIFDDGSFLMILGAESAANRQSHTFKCIVKDEAWMYQPGWNREIDNRAKAFERTNDYKIMAMGTGGVKGEEFANDHYSGTCEVYKVPCEHCGEYYEYKWDIRDGGVFRWEEIVGDDGKLDYLKIRETVHIECPHCHGKIYYDQQRQRQAAAKGKWFATNPQADGSRVTLKIPCFVAGKDWGEFVEQWLRIGKGRTVGFKAALKDLIIFDLAEFWEDRPIVEKKSVKTGEYTRQEMIDARMDGELIRTATIDYQHGMRGDGEHFWFTVRAWIEIDNIDEGKIIESRLVDCGRVNEVAELNERIIAAGVQRVESSHHAYSRVWMDCAFKQSVVFDMCAKYLWCGVRGEDRNLRSSNGNFLHNIQEYRGGPTYKTYKSFSEVKFGEVGVGKTSQFAGHVPWRSINTQGCEDMLYELRTGQSSIRWTVPKDIEDFCPEYLTHINSHARINVSKDQSKEEFRWTLVGNPEQNPDHLYDCEKYQVALALYCEIMEDATSKESN